MFSPNFVARVNVKPLLPDQAFSGFKPDKLLKEMGREILKAVARNIRQEAFSNAAKRRLSNGMKIQIGRNSITVLAIDPAFKSLLEGQRRGQMKWLVKAQRPIPIVLDSGKVIFRWATPKSMANGSWVHPGRAPTTVIERARVEARKQLKKRAKELFRRQLRAMLRTR